MPHSLQYSNNRDQENINKSVLRQKLTEEGLIGWCGVALLRESTGQE